MIVSWLDNEVWRGSCNLSGGQQQLLSLARAALRPSPVLILDEPSSALDQEAENNLHRCLKTLFKDRTIVLVAVSIFKSLELVDISTSNLNGKCFRPFNN